MKCECSCDCKELSSTIKEVPLCENCCHGTASIAGEDYCFKQLGSDLSLIQCPDCQGTVQWGMIHKSSEWAPNQMGGTCQCPRREWTWRETGAWMIEGISAVDKETPCFRYSEESGYSQTLEAETLEEALQEAKELLLNGSWEDEYGNPPQPGEQFKAWVWWTDENGEDREEIVRVSWPEPENSPTTE